MALISLDIHYCLQYLIWFITVVVVHSFIRKFLKPARTLVPEPPSPPALPFIGHLHLVSSVLPKSFQELARVYGPLMGIRLGASSCLVVSNAAVAKEIFKTQELNFCSRPEFGSSEYFIYRGSRFVLAQYGDYWRFMKKLCMTRLLAVPQLDKFANIRDQEKVKLVESVIKCCREGKTCDLSSEFTTLTNNTICRMTMSTRCSGSDNDAAEIKELIRTCLELSGKISVGDVLGPFKVLDFSGNGNKLKAALLKYDRLVDRIIKEHQEKESEGFDGNQKMDLLDILLEVYRDPTAEVKISMKDIKSFLLAKTRVLVNVYAVMRDPDSWANPNEFDPERFLGGSDEKIGEHQMEFKGQNFRFLPFGSGRRGCPGASLAMLVMHAAVGSLVQCFDWEVKGGGKVDLSPGPGFATEMAHPLVCYPTVSSNPF
ncbi:hypothetical protein V6N13_130023 [Hibiscus sabdariffa]